MGVQCKLVKMVRVHIREERERRDRPERREERGESERREERGEKREERAQKSTPEKEEGEPKITCVKVQLAMYEIRTIFGLFTNITTPQQQP